MDFIQAKLNRFVGTGLNIIGSFTPKTSHTLIPFTIIIFVSAFLFDNHLKESNLEDKAMVNIECLYCLIPGNMFCL